MHMCLLFDRIITYNKENILDLLSIAYIYIASAMANRQPPLADSLHLIVNKLEHLWGHGYV